MSMLAVVGTILLGASVVACGDPDGVGGQIAETPWILTGGTADGSDIAPIPTAPVTLAFFSDGTLGGSAACNSYGGDYAVDGSDISFPAPFVQTEMACPGDGVMELERRFLDALNRVTAFTATERDLVLSGPDVELRFVREDEPQDVDLVGTEWILDTLVSGETVSTPSAPATLVFRADGSVTGSTGCNGFGGSYDPVTGFSELASTLMACEEPIMAQEQLVLSVLRPGVTAIVDGDRLTIVGPGGASLVYRSG